MSSVFETGKTIGLELEAPDIRDFCKLSGFSRAHDASVITPAKGKDKIVWEKIPANLLGFEQYSLGTELVSSYPIPINDDLENYLKSQLSNLFAYGQREETSLSNRAGIHIHITAPVHLGLFKEILSLGCHLEDVFFLISGFGKPHRGILNDCIYARPITKFGPPIINSDYGSAKVFEIDDLLESKDIDEFIYRYGNSNRFRDRYVPVRYTWLNLLPIVSQGSLEFRSFNITQNPIYLSSVVFLVKWFLEKCIERSYDRNKKFEKLKENSVFDYRDKEDIISTLIENVEGEIEDKHLKVLVDIMEKTPIESIRLKRVYIYSHLMVHPTRGNSTGTFWHNRDEEYLYKPKIIEDKILKPSFMDSHQSKNFTTKQKKSFFKNIKPKKIIKLTKKEKDQKMHDFLNSREEEISSSYLNSYERAVRQQDSRRNRAVEPRITPPERPQRNIGTVDYNITSASTSSGAGLFTNSLTFNESESPVEVSSEPSQQPSYYYSSVEGATVEITGLESGEEEIEEEENNNIDF